MTATTRNRPAQTGPVPIHQGRRWVTPTGGRIDLYYLTGTRGALDPALRDGGAVDGWVWVVTAPSGWVNSTVYLGASLAGVDLTPALTEARAYEVTGLPTPKGSS
jgi:hypothetical protein